MFLYLNRFCPTPINLYHYLQHKHNNRLRNSVVEFPHPVCTSFYHPYVLLRNLFFLSSRPLFVPIQDYTHATVLVGVSIAVAADSTINNSLDDIIDAGSMFSCVIMLTIRITHIALNNIFISHT